jgi:hypothetical protein
LLAGRAVVGELSDGKTRVAHFSAPFRWLQGSFDEMSSYLKRLQELR